MVVVDVVVDVEDVVVVGGTHASEWHNPGPAVSPHWSSHTVSEIQELYKDAEHVQQDGTDGAGTSAGADHVMDTGLLTA